MVRSFDFPLESKWVCSWSEKTNQFVWSLNRLKSDPQSETEVHARKVLLVGRDGRIGRALGENTDRCRDDASVSLLPNMRVMPR